MSETHWKIAGEKLAAELVKTLPAQEAREVCELVAAQLVRDRKSDLGRIADKLHTELLWEFASTPGAAAIIVSHARQTARKWAKAARDERKG